MLAVGRPMQRVEDSFALEYLAGLAACCIDQIDSVGVERLLTLGMGIGEERDALTVGRGFKLFDAPGRSGELPGAREEIARFGWTFGEAVLRFLDADSVNSIAALGFTELDDVLPIFLVGLLLLFGPMAARGEVYLVRIG